MKQKVRRPATLFSLICIAMVLMCLDTIVARAAATVYVTLSVGESTTIVDDSGNYADDYDSSTLDTGIATAAVVGETTHDTTVYSGTLVTSATSGSAYYVGDGINYLVLSGGTISTTTDITQATAFTWTVNNQGQTTRYLSYGSYYLRYNSGSWSATTSNRDRTSFSAYSGTLEFSQGPFNTSTDDSLYTMTSTTVQASASTDITFTGVAAGTTTLTVGDTTYIITVAAESSASTASPFLAGTGDGAGYAVTKLTISKTLSFDLNLNEDALASTSYTVAWTSADTSVATVDTNGTVTGVDAGTTTITAVVTYDDGSSETFTIPVVVRDDGVSYSSTLKIYDFYVTEITHTTAYYGVLYGTTNSNVTAYDLVQLQEGEAVYIAFEATAGTAVDFFASPDDGYAVTYMASTNSAGHYMALDSTDPASTTFITRTDAAGANQVTAFGSTVVYALVQKALNAGCDAAMGWTRASGSTGGVTSLLTFRSHRLPTVAKEVTLVNDEAYTAGMTIEVEDIITYTITVTQYATGEEAITYSDETLTEELAGALFTDTNALTTTPTLIDGVLTYDIATTYTVTYTVAEGNLGKTLTNKVALSCTYETEYCYGSHSEAAEVECSITIVNFYPTGLVVDYGLPLEIDYTAHHGSNNLKDGTFTYTYGTITVSSNKVTFVPTSVITEPVTVTLTDVEDIQYTFKIYPATTVYYEEGFASYGTGWNVDTGSEHGWSNYTNKGKSTSTQEAHTAVDTSTNSLNGYNNYGYDGAYADDTGGSDGTAAIGDSLSFTFTGTGVDIFANCDSGSGMVAIRVAGSDGTVYKLLFVDMANNGAYAVSGTAYNTPIASVSGLTHGSYIVTIYLVTINSSGFQFDGFRVYDTIAQDTGASAASDAYTIQTTVYYTDDEDYPVYYELRNAVLYGLSADTAKSTYKDDLYDEYAQVYASKETKASGAIVVYDSNSKILNKDSASISASDTEKVQSLLDDGPKNELYLYPGGSVVFKVTTSREVQLGMRSVTGASVTYTVSATDSSGNAVDIAGTTTGSPLSSSVDMFYDLIGKTGTETEYIITITNISSDGILSLSDIKESDSSGDGSIFEELTAEDLVAALTGETEEEASEGSADSQTEEETTGSAGSETKTEGATARAASLEVNLSDYTGSVIATTTLAKNGAAGEKTTFAASDILAAANVVLPDGYALVSADDIADRTAVYGESSSLNLQIGRVATLTVTCVKSGTSTVATVTLTKVQTGPGITAVFTASEIRAAIPADYQVLLVTSVRVNYGSGESTVVTVY